MFTPLHAASAGGQITVVKMLLELGVDVDAVNAFGNTSLHVACLNSNDIVVSELIGHGAVVNALNHRGQVYDVIISSLPSCDCKLATRQLYGRLSVNQVDSKTS